MSLSSSKGDDHQIPLFRVPSFNGDTIAGDKHIEDVDHVFRAHAMAKYLEDAIFCDAKTARSGTFASCIRKSIADNSILGYLTTSLKAIDNYCEVWDAIEIKLNTGDVTITRMISHWNQLFALKYEDRESFLVFYSQSKKLLFKLEKSKLIAVTDDIFLCAYFSKVIEVPEI